MIGSTCFHCGEEIKKNMENQGNSYRLIPLERPYANLFIHFIVCYPEVMEIGLEQYLQDNFEKIGPYNCGVPKKWKRKEKDDEEKTQ